MKICAVMSLAYQIYDNINIDSVSGEVASYAGSDTDQVHSLMRTDSIRLHGYVICK